MKQIKYILLCSFLFSCSTNFDSKQNKKILLTTHTGWWVYGQGHHIFKDEKTLEEWKMFFLNEDKEEVELLYLEITEMEYFPLECTIQANIFEKDNEKIVEIADFEITYIQGCGD